MTIIFLKADVYGYVSDFLLVYTDGFTPNVWEKSITLWIHCFCMGSIFNDRRNKTGNNIYRIVNYYKLLIIQ